MTHSMSSCRTTSDTLVFSRAALTCTANHRVSSMRMFRSVVPRAMSTGQGFDAFPAQVRHGIECGIGVDVLQVGVTKLANVAVGAATETFVVGAGSLSGCVAHGLSVPTPSRGRNYLLGVA